MRDDLTEIMLVGNEITGPYEEAENLEKLATLLRRVVTWKLIEIWSGFQDWCSTYLNSWQTWEDRPKKFLVYSPSESVKQY